MAEGGVGAEGAQRGGGVDPRHALIQVYAVIVIVVVFVIFVNVYADFLLYC